MSLREILRWPDPRLSRVCGVVPGGADVSALVADLFDTMYAAPGRGLAAPQIGVMARVFVMDTGWKEGVSSPVAMINPEIMSRSEEIVTGEEACLSIPGVSGEVPRPATVRMRWLDLTGARQEAVFSGAEARCAQHELDHLEGRVYLDLLEAGRRAEIEALYEAAP